MQSTVIQSINTQIYKVDEETPIQPSLYEIETHMYNITLITIKEHRSVTEDQNTPTTVYKSFWETLCFSVYKYERGGIDTKLLHLLNSTFWSHLAVHGYKKWANASPNTIYYFPQVLYAGTKFGSIENTILLLNLEATSFAHSYKRHNTLLSRVNGTITSCTGFMCQTSEFY